MQPKPDDYKKVFSEIIQKEIAVFGPTISFSRIQEIPRLHINEKGEIVSFDGDGLEILHKLIDQTVELSDIVGKQIIDSVLSKYPPISVLIPHHEASLSSESTTSSEQKANSSSPQSNELAHFLEQSSSVQDQIQDLNTTIKNVSYQKVG